MRRLAIAALAGLSLAASVAPVARAQAAWHVYVSHKLGFSFDAPGEIASQSGTYRGAIAGPHQTTLFRSSDNGIDYKVTVISFRQGQAEGATILGEREYMFQDGKKVLTDTFRRVEQGKDAIYGRTIAVDLPNNGGRDTAAFYFTQGRLYMFEATDLPATANYASPDAKRFIDSVIFHLDRIDKGATELKLPE